MASSTRTPECAPKWSTRRTPSRKTLGVAASKIASELGKPLLPWQQHVMDVALEVEDGRFVYREVIVGVPRQQGKTTLILTLILLRALRSAGERIVYTAQTRNDARRKLVDDWLPDLDHTPFKQFYRTRLANGSEALRFSNGSLASLVATTKKSGHGGTLDLAILDEAFAQADARMEQSLKPAMMTRPQPQLWVVSTAGTPSESPYLLDKVEKGRQIAESGLTHSVAYFEWKADDDADPGDIATWRDCMPALGRTVTEEAVRADFESMELSEFRRAYLNQWTTTSVDPVIPMVTWDGLTDTRSTALNPVAIAFDIPPSRSSGAIAAAGKRPDGKTHIEVVDQRDGISWLAPAVAQVVKTQHPCVVFCDRAGPAAALIPELERLGVRIETTESQDMVRACGLFYDAAMNDQLRHLGTHDLRDALDGAVKRPLNDAWAWSRKNSQSNIACLVATTLAHWGLSTHGGMGEGVWDLNEIAARLMAEDKAKLQDPVRPEPSAPPAQPGTQRFVSLKDFYNLPQ